LRHGAATKMIMNGAPIPAVQKMLGHSNIQTTMVYTHPNIEDLREAVAKL
jgi:site-specific recombinase XerD